MKVLASFALVRPILARYRLRLVAGLAALLLVDLLQLGIPRLTKHGIDLLEQGGADRSALVRIALAVLALALCIAAGRFVWRTLILGFSRLLEQDLRALLFRRLLLLDRQFFQKKPVGEIMALAANDLSAVQLAAGMGLVAAVDAIFMGSTALACMFFISPELSLIALLPMPFLALLTRLLSGRLHQRFLAVQEQFARLTEFARNTITGIRLLKANTQEAARIEGFNRLGLDSLHDNLRLARIHGVLFPVSGLVANLSLLLVIFFGGRLVLAGSITVGDFVAFTAYLALLTWPMMAVGWVASLFQRGMTSLGRIEELMAAQPGLGDPNHPLALPSGAGGLAIDLRELHFRYPGRENEALSGLTLSIGAGELVGLVGKSGSGKSTLCHLLAREYPVEAGCVFINGVDITRLSLAVLREQVAYVPQDVLLFSDTVAANIAFGRPEAGLEQIEAAARICRIHEEIIGFPDAYQSMVGERGVSLSGGQRQRIALARAILLDRPLLIIDDGLSAVDLETERQIIDGLAAHLAGRTCLVVSHRSAALLGASRVLVFGEGRLEDQGSPAELLAKNPFFQVMARRVNGLAGRKEG